MNSSYQLVYEAALSQPKTNPVVSAAVTVKAALRNGEIMRFTVVISAQKFPGRWSSSSRALTELRPDLVATLSRNGELEARLELIAEVAPQINAQVARSYLAWLAGDESDLENLIETVEDYTVPLFV